MYSTSNQTVINLTFKGFVILFLLSSCSSSRMPYFKDLVQSEPLDQSFHALVVRDPSSQEVLYSHNGDRYFTPASNTKIVTLYSGIKLLPDHAPALKYNARKDTLYFEGTGDPTLAHPYFKEQTTLTFLKDYKVLYWVPNNTSEDRYGPGWAWEDYDTYFSPEKSELPIYGNVVTTWKDSSRHMLPEYFKKDLKSETNKFRRAEFKNDFYVPEHRTDTLEIPFIIDEALTLNLLEEALNMRVYTVNQFPEGPKQTLSGIPMDSIYKRMMHKSDNFLAEQILMMASSTLSDTLSTRTAINHMLEHYLNDLNTQPRWVDGSGLSRYNLFTPKSFTTILQKLYNEVSHDRLLTLFPMWDETGTVEHWTHSDIEPFIFAKSGSFGNHYNLSGYIKTSSGKLLIFSMMNNHFRVPSSQIRAEIYATLKEIHRSY